MKKKGDESGKRVSMKKMKCFPHRAQAMHAGRKEKHDERACRKRAVVLVKT